MDVSVTVHGFRSGFRDWAAECTGYAHEVAEMALAHAIESAVERAYRRGDLFDKRRRLMEDWATYCGSKQADRDNVRPPSARLRPVRHKLHPLGQFPTSLQHSELGT